MSQFMTLAAGWKLFTESVVPPDATEHDIRGMQTAFYAGALVLANCQKTIMEVHPVKKHRMVLLKALLRECSSFIMEEISR